MEYSGCLVGNREVDLEEEGNLKEVEVEHPLLVELEEIQEEEVEVKNQNQVV